ncbi:MAG: hypothetical protein KY437_10770, partial [Actinobacteria bacterium]|nr:hypothetical protein [Actinomycetota bacterium]
MPRRPLPRRPLVLAAAALVAGGALTGGIALATSGAGVPAAPPEPARAAERAPSPPPLPTGSRAQLVEPAAGGAPAVDAREQVPEALEDAIAES